MTLAEAKKIHGHTLVWYSQLPSLVSELSLFVGQEGGKVDARRTSEQEKLQAMLTISPELKVRYELKEYFHLRFNVALDQPTTEKELRGWIACIEAGGFRDLHAFVNTLTNLCECILNHFVFWCHCKRLHHTSINY